MPVEIRELVIKAVIAAGDADEGETGAAPAGAPAWGAAEQQELIQACVEQVLKVLKKEKLR